MTHGSSPSRTEEPKKPLLSPVQVFASSAAAVSAAVVTSFFGVAGTLVGAAVTSIVATIGSALYAHSLQLTRQRLRQRWPFQGDADERPNLGAVVRTAVDEFRHHARQLPWRGIGLATVTVFVVALAVLTLFEGLVGRTISALVGPDSSGKGQTSIERVVGVHPRSPSPTPSESPSEEPTATPSTTETPSPTPESPSPDSSEEPSTSPSPEATQTTATTGPAGEPAPPAERTPASPPSP